MAGNKNLSAAKAAKKDEFYTQLADIENELRYYKEHFRGKTTLDNGMMLCADCNRKKSDGTLTIINGDVINDGGIKITNSGFASPL